jgi:hypothetical protein
MEEMPMENIKEKVSDLIHHYTAIGILVLFLFSGNETILPSANALVVKPTITTEVIAKEETLKAKQLKTKTLEKFSNTVYKSSEMLTDKELVTILKSVGFEGSALKMAWAIAKTESNGRPMAYNGNRKTGDSSYGIFQINMLGTLGTDRKEKFDLRSNVLLFDPVVNAEITYRMTRGGKDWSSWPNSLSNARKLIKEFPKI